MEEKYVAITVKKIKLNNNLYFLVPNGIIKDASMTTDKSLVDTNNDKYLSFDDPKFYLSKHNDLAYMYPLTHKSVMEVYCKQNFKEAIKKYMDYFNSDVYFVNLDNNQDLKIVHMKKSSIIKSDKNSIDTSIINTVKTSDDVKLTLSEKILDDMVNKLKKNDLEYLELILKGLKQICNNARDNYNDGNNTSLPPTIKQQNKTTSEIETEPKLDIKKVYKEMLEEVVGQDDIIKEILMAVEKNIYANLYPDGAEDRYHILIVGPSGSGKTRTMRSLQKYLDLPVVRVDTTQITMNGYHGGTIEDNILRPLLVQTNGNLELAKVGIVNLDEIDKKGSKDNQDVAGRGVLNAFLPFLDGTTYEVKYKSEVYTFDTSSLTVLASGAFTDILKQGDSKIGFVTASNHDKIISKEILEKKGDIPIEFLGRFPSLAQMRTLSDKDLKEILDKPKTSPLTFRTKYLLDCYNVDLKYENDYLDAIVKKALALGTGARSLKEIVEQSLRIAEWQIIESEGLRQYKELVVLAETVEDPKKYILR